MSEIGLPLVLEGQWGDIIWELGAIPLTDESDIYVDMTWEGNASVSLRFCFLSESDAGRELELWREYPVGRSVFSFRLSDLVGKRPEAGDVIVQRLYFGGVGEGKARIVIAIFEPKKLLFSAA